MSAESSRVPRAWGACLASSSVIQVLLCFAFTTHQALENLAVYLAKDQSFLTCLSRSRLLCSSSGVPPHGAISIRVTCDDKTKPPKQGGLIEWPVEGNPRGALPEGLQGAKPWVTHAIQDPISCAIICHQV